MLRLVSYDIVFQEIPGEVTLALNLSGCPNRCPGCHSPHLQEHIGEKLDMELLSSLLKRYGDSVTCVCFMGGDGDPAEIGRLSVYIRTGTTKRLKTAWYSGRTALPAGFSPQWLDYLKLGPYVDKLGGLNSQTTNQRLYRIVDGVYTDITSVFRK